jgi:hypothetical protein
VGWTLLALVLATEIVRLTLSRFLLGRRWLGLLILLLSGLVLIGIGYGKWRLYEWGDMPGRPNLPRRLGHPLDQLKSNLAGAVCDEARDRVARRSGWEAFGRRISG